MTQTKANPLPVQDVLSVFADVDRSRRVTAPYILIELLTSEGLLVLKVPQPMARELTESLSQASEDEGVAWVPEYRFSDTPE